MKYIGDAAFLGCESLRDLVIPDSVTTINERAFYECETLTSAYIPESVSAIGTRALGYNGYDSSTKKFIKISGFKLLSDGNPAVETYAAANGFSFAEPEYAKGDCNGDGELTIADIVLLKKNTF